MLTLRATNDGLRPARGASRGPGPARGALGVPALPARPARGHEAVPACQVFVVAGIGPAAFLGEDPVDRRALRRAVFHGHQAVRAEQPGGHLLDDPDRVQAVAAAPQRPGRVVLADLGRHRCPDGYVRGVADYQVNLPVEAGQRPGEVPGVQDDPARGERCVVGGAGHVTLGPLPGERVGLDGVHPGPGNLLGDRQRYRARTRTQVGHDRVGDIHLLELADRPAGHHLGLRARYEDTGPDFELGVPEVGEAGDVLERLAGLPAGDLVPEPRLEA